MNTARPHPEWRLIVDYLAQKPYGEVVTHVEIAAASDLVPQSGKYFSQMKTARKHLLLDWSRELETRAGQGYRLVEPIEFKRRVRRQITIAGRHDRRAIAIAVSAPSRLLSDAENARLADLAAKLGAREAGRRSLMATTRPSLPPPPRADVPKMLSS